MTEETESGDEQQSRDDIWSERAASLVVFVRSSKPPVLRGTLATFAMRKGWEQKTLDACLDYCVEMKLLAKFASYKGDAWKIPFTPVPQEGPTFDEALAATPAAEPARKPRAPKEKSTMKEWLTAKEAAKVAGCSPRYVRLAADAVEIEGHIDTEFQGIGRKPRMFKRSSVIAFRDKRSKRSATDLLDKPTRKKTSTVTKPKRVKRAESTALVLPKTTAVLAAIDPSIIDDVRALHGMVKRGGMETNTAWETLCALMGVEDLNWIALCSLLGVS